VLLDFPGMIKVCSKFLVVGGRTSVESQLIVTNSFLRAAISAQTVSQFELVRFCW
jgi:hypothetical protein